jgi:hypothetical protein
MSVATDLDSTHAVLLQMQKNQLDMVDELKAMAKQLDAMAIHMARLNGYARLADANPALVEPSVDYRHPKRPSQIDPDDGGNPIIKL